MVLATDGKPNFCDFHDGLPSTAEEQQLAVDTVAALASDGTYSFAISMAGGDADLQAHLEDIATAGATGQAAFSPTTGDALVAALSAIVGNTVSCELSIEGSIVQGRQCAGDVRLNGTPLVCDDPNGFRVKDDLSTLELLGAACEQFQQEANPELSATFACEDVMLI